MGVTARLRIVNGQNTFQEFGFLEWQMGSETWTFCKFIEFSPNGRFVATLERGDMSWVSVWKVKESGELDTKVYSTKGREFFVQDIEWVGRYLLILVLDGVKTIADLHEVKSDEYLCQHSRILIWDSEHGKESDFLKGDFQLMFAYQKRKVLLFHRRQHKKEHIGQCRVSIYLVPQGTLITHFRLELNYDPADPLIREGRYPLFWCPDGKRFWMIDEYSEVRPEIGTLSVPILRVIDLNGESKIISGEPRKRWLIVKDCPLLVRECPDGYDDIRGTNHLAIYGPPAVLVSGKLCGVAMAGWNKLRSIGFFNENGLVKEIPLERKRFEPLKLSLNKLGIKHCEIKAIAPDGHRLVLQELREEKKGVVEDAFEVPFGEKRWILVWDMKAQTLKQVALTGWIDEVYGWLDSSRLVVRVKGLKEDTWQHGLLCLPDKSSYRER
ncbi:MAG: hypothetical protein NZ531_03900 [Aquificaceae bacterium]|nr:hypothetical protein [Aquificaceae bacterium]